MFCAYFSGAAAAGKRSRASKWDDKSAASSTTDWGKKWRAVVKAVLPKDGAGGATCMDHDVQKLCLAMWRDLTSWAEEDCRQHLMLFQADQQGLELQFSLPLSSSFQLKYFGF